MSEVIEPEDPSIESLIERARAGDETAWIELSEHFKPEAIRTIQRHFDVKLFGRLAFADTAWPTIIASYGALPNLTIDPVKQFLAATIGEPKASPREDRVTGKRGALDSEEASESGSSTRVSPGRLSGSPSTEGAGTERQHEDTPHGLSPLVPLSGRSVEGLSIQSLSDLIKEDLRRRFNEGERPSVYEYLRRFPQLSEESDRMISLIYEEYCLREEVGERPDREEFANSYEPWRDSLLSQLHYHELFSKYVVLQRKKLLDSPRLPAILEAGT